MEWKASDTVLMLYLERCCYIGCFFSFFFIISYLFIIYTKYSHTITSAWCFPSFFFIALHHGRPALTHTRNAGEGCGSRLLLPDILRCTCHLTFHSNDGQGRVTAFSLSQRAFLNIFSSSRCIRWQNGNRRRFLAVLMCELDTRSFI